MSETKPCGSCKMAERNPMTGYYHAGCSECQARALAHSMGFVASVAHGRFRDDYTAALKTVAGEKPEEIDKLHAMVKRWAKRIDEWRAHG
jgi:hypothetical protein